MGILTIRNSSEQVLRHDGTDMYGIYETPSWNSSISDSCKKNPAKMETYPIQVACKHMNVHLDTDNINRTHFSLFHQFIVAVTDHFQLNEGITKDRRRS